MSKSMRIAPKGVVAEKPTPGRSENHKSMKPPKTPKGGASHCGVAGSYFGNSDACNSDHFSKD